MVDQLDKLDFSIDIHVLGLRDLESSGILPVKKPYIKFNMRGLLPPSQQLAMRDIRTDPRGTGPNANINSLVTLQLDLPNDEIFCPSLSCEVFDFVCKGLSQPKLGTFTIDLAKILRERREHVEELHKAGLQLEDWLNLQLQNALPMPRSSLLPLDQLVDDSESRPLMRNESEGSLVSEVAKQEIDELKMKYLSTFGIDEDFEPVNAGRN